MYALDFEYDGQYLSDYGFIICEFNGSSGVKTAAAGSKITFNTVSRHGGKQNGLIGTQYNECIQAKFHICKNPDLFDDLSISHDEYRDLMRWLNRNEFLKFQILYDFKDDKTREPCCFNASFNIGKITIGDILYGLELSMETDKPFGYGEEQVYAKNISDTQMVYQIMDQSDEIGTTYVTMKITCNDSGDLSINNATECCNTVIKNCVAGEVIIIDGDTLTIVTSELNHKICNDFNYDFPRIGNTLTNRANKIMVSLPCQLEIRYRPIIKDIP